MHASARPRGFTLIELLVVVAVVATVLVLAAPGMRDLVLMQRLRGINSQLVTDLQFARSEAVVRRDYMRLAFSTAGGMSCYTIYTAPDGAGSCDCTQGSGAACSGLLKEVRTVQVPNSSAVFMSPTNGLMVFAFDYRTGGILGIPSDGSPFPIREANIQAYIDGARKLETRLNPAGRPTVCAPSGSTMSEERCP